MMSAVEFFSIAKDIVLAVAVAITACVAVTGLKNWQKELRGKANFEIARQLLRATYHLRNELSYCRAPRIPRHEFPEEHLEGLGNHTAENQGQTYHHVYSKRLKPVNTALQEFDAVLLEGEVLWGTNIKKKGSVFRRCVKKLASCIEGLIDNELSGGKHFENDEKLAKKVRAGVEESSLEGNDELTNEINAAVEGLEQEIRPHLTRS